MAGFDSGKERADGQDGPDGPEPRTYEERVASLYPHFFGKEPPALHDRLSPASLWITSLSRAKVCGAALALSLVGCGLWVAAVLGPPHYGGYYGAFGMVLGFFLFLLLLELAHYGARFFALLLVLAAGATLLFTGWFGFRALVLADVGRWTTVEVTEKHAGRRGSSCQIQPLVAPEPLRHHLRACDDLTPGQQLSVWVDRDDMVPAARSRPEPWVPLGVGGASATVLVAASVLGAYGGHRRREELGLLGLPPEFDDEDDEGASGDLPR